MADIELNGNPVDPSQEPGTTAAVDYDLTTAGSYTIINGVIYTDAANTGSGTGNYNTFLAVQDSNDAGDTEAGFNTDDTPPLDGSNNEIDHSKTHTVLLSDLVQIMVEGQAYYEFRVDLNEANSDPNSQISLDAFQLYTSSLSSIQSLTQLQAQNLIYSLDSGGVDRDVLLSEAASTGSGTDDYAVLVPVSAFAGLNPTTTYIYLYTEFGGAGSAWAVNGGFEEWNLQNGVTLTGVKFNDANGNGIREGSEAGVGGVTIFIDENKNGVFDAGERSTTTASDGSYSFYGVALNQTVWIDEVIPAGSTQTTGLHEEVVISSNAAPGSTIVVDPIGNFNPIDLSGTKYLDVNGDGQITGDGGLGNVTIFIDMDNSGTFNAGDISTVTANDGTWSFSNLAAAVIGHKVLEVLPSGYIQTLGNAGYTINGDASGLNFANFNAIDLSGTKYLDANGDGQTTGDSGLAGVTIFIDMDSSGSFNAGDISTTTGAGGAWSFTGLGPNVLGKTVYEVLPSGYAQTLGNAGYLISGDANNLNFANFDLVDLSGTKYLDANGDGQTTGDSGLAGVTIFIDMDNSGSFNAGDISTTTGAGGAWSLTGLGPNVLGKTIYEVLQSGYQQTLGNAGYVITGDRTGINFANFNLVDLSGTKYLDANGDGQTTGDSGLAGVTIFIDMDNSGSFNAGDISTTTGAGGAWSFTGLGPNVLGKTVYEVLPSGYAQTLGNAGYLISGDANNLNFANFNLVDLSGTKYRDMTGNGISGDDVGLGGVTIFIDMDNSGSFNAGDISTTTAAGTGAWSFSGLGSNVLGKTIYEVLPGGYAQTVGNAGYVINGDASGLNFANFNLVDLSGTKYRDMTGNGISGDDVGLGGVTIFIDMDNSGSFNAGDISTTTAAGTGAWSFSGLGSNVLGKTIYEVLPGGYAQTVGNAGYVINGDASGLNFANFNLVDLSGTKYLDANGDGSVVGDVGLAGVTIFIDMDNSGTFTMGDISTTSGAGGAWSFTGLGSNVLGHTVYEQVPGGYTQTLGNAGYLISGDATGLNFANHLDDLGPGVRTPGFWQNMKNGGLFWDGITGNEKNAGADCFPDGELLYQVDSDNNGSVDTLGLLIGDYNGNGLTDAGEDTIFISYDNARLLINANNSTMSDGVMKIGRDVVATWLNYLAGNGIGTVADTNSPRHFIDDAIDYLQRYGDANLSNTNDPSETFDVFAWVHGGVKTGTSAWTMDQPGDSHSGSDIHSALDYYNNTGMTSPTSAVYAHDCDDAMFVTAYGLTQDALI